MHLWTEFLREAFAIRHDEGTTHTDSAVLDLGSCTVEAYLMNHGIPSLAWIVREKPKVNVDVSRMSALGLRPGPWLKQLTTSSDQADDTAVTVGAESFPLARLRELLLVKTPGDSIAYFTDFLLDDAARERLVPTLQGVTTLVCEAQYRASDLELAQRHFHMTTRLTAELAREAGVGQLLLFHLSSRYAPDIWSEMLREAQAIFPRTGFPSHWRLEKGRGVPPGTVFPNISAIVEAV